MEFSIVQPHLDERAISSSKPSSFPCRQCGRRSPAFSHKGGPPGFVRVIDPTTIVFPSYDGNGMFLSMGNIGGGAGAKISMLFIDFETRIGFGPRRRHRGADDPSWMPSRCPNAGSCDHHRLVHQLPRYIVKHERVDKPLHPGEHGDAPGNVEADRCAPALPSTRSVIAAGVFRFLPTVRSGSTPAGLGNPAELRAFHHA